MDDNRKAVEFIQKSDPEMRIIAAELAENGALVSRLWGDIARRASADPNQALDDLVTLEIRLDNLIRVEVDDALRIVRSAARRFQPDPD